MIDHIELTDAQRELIRGHADYIEANVHAYNDVKKRLFESTDDELPKAFYMGGWAGKVFDDTFYGNVCGMSCCIGGHAMMHAGYRFDSEYGDLIDPMTDEVVSDYVRASYEAFGFEVPTRGNAPIHPLFFMDTWPEVYQRYDDEHDLLDPEPDDAVRLMRDLADDVIVIVPAPNFDAGFPIYRLAMAEVMANSEN